MKESGSVQISEMIIHFFYGKHLNLDYRVKLNKPLVFSSGNFALPRIPHFSWK